MLADAAILVVDPRVGGFAAELRDVLERRGAHCMLAMDAASAFNSSRLFRFSIVALHGTIQIPANVFTMPTVVYDDTFGYEDVVTLIANGLNRS